VSATTYNKPTILIVDDCVDDLELLQFAMKNLRFFWELRFAHDGEAAIEYVKGEQRFVDRKANPFPDLVLLDVRLPKIDGFQVLEWIRSAPECRTLKVIVWTGSEHPEYPNRARSLGAVGFFMKGDLARVRELVSCMSSALTGGIAENAG
jgi:CheY-like chemotaxis protein